MKKLEQLKTKLLTNNAAQVSQEELLSLLWSYNETQKEEAIEQSKLLFQEYGNNILKIAQSSIQEIHKRTKIGLEKIIPLKAILELVYRKDHYIDSRVKIQSSSDAYSYFNYLMVLPHEEFWVIFLDQGNRVIMKSELFKGGVSGTVVDVRLIAKTGIEVLASSVVVAHNHPSGQLKPSQADKVLTKKIKDALCLVDIKLLDHLILGYCDYYSFADDGLI